MSNVVHPDIRKMAVKEYAKGHLPIADIAKKYRVCQRSIAIWAKADGVELRYSGRPSKPWKGKKSETQAL